MQRLEIRRENVTLSYLDSGGSGPTVVLLHGLAGSAQELAATAAAISDRHRVLVLDRRGHGHSTRRPDDVSRRAYVDDVAALIDTAAGGSPVSVVGQSMGAHTALLLAAWHPRLVQRLVLLEGGVGGGEDSSAELGSWFASWPVPFPSRQAAVEHHDATPIAEAWAQDLEEREDGFRPRFDADVMQAAIAAVAEVARWAEWQQVQASTLLVQAERSYLDAAEIEQLITLRPGTGHVVVADAGHDVHLDQPQAWIRLLRSYLDTGHTPSGD